MSHIHWSHICHQEYISNTETKRLRTIQRSCSWGTKVFAPEETKLDNEKSRKSWERIAKKAWRIMTKRGNQGRIQQESHQRREKRRERERRAQDPLELLSVDSLFAHSAHSHPSLFVHGCFSSLSSHSLSLLLSHKTSVCLLPSFSSVRASNETGSRSCESLLFAERSSSSFGEKKKKKFYPGLLHNLNTHLPSSSSTRLFLSSSAASNKKRNLQKEETTSWLLCRFACIFLLFILLLPLKCFSEPIFRLNLFYNNFGSVSWIPLFVW